MKPIPAPHGLPPVQMQFQKIPKGVPGPNGERCDLCRHWVQSIKKRLVQLQGGQQALVSDLIKAGVKMPDPDFIVTASQCTEAPMWSPTTDDHWCSHFVPLQVS